MSDYPYGTLQRSAIIKEKLLIIANYTDEHPEFDTDFVDSLAKQFASKTDLSDKQIKALENIIERWRMDD